MAGPAGKPASGAVTVGRFQCALTVSDEPRCETYARVTVVDAVGGSARGCPAHAVTALRCIDGARVDWADTKGLNEYERRALELTEDPLHVRRSR